MLEDVKLFVLDMDGTFYLEDTALDGSLDFIERVKQSSKEFLFFTNNSSKAAEDYIKKLEKMNCIISRAQIITSADVMIDYLNVCYPGKTVYLLGTPELERSFSEHGICLTDQSPDIVAVGFDMTLTYKKLAQACQFIRGGAVFLATHPDINCPTREGFIPDCGAICAAIMKATGKEPLFLGKPFVQSIEMIMKRTGRRCQEIAFVGDRLYTDVAAGVNHGAKGFLVLSGEAKMEDITHSPVKPDAVFSSLKEMADFL